MMQLDLFDELTARESEAVTTPPLPLHAGDICKFTPLLEHMNYYRDFHPNMIGKEVIVEAVVKQTRLAAWIYTRTDRTIVYAEELQLVHSREG